MVWARKKIREKLAETEGYLSSLIACVSASALVVAVVMDRSLPVVLIRIGIIRMCMHAEFGARLLALTIETQILIASR